MKKQVQQFLQKEFPNVQAAYSGKTKTLFLKPTTRMVGKRGSKSAVDHADSAILEKFGMGLDFRLGR